MGAPIGPGDFVECTRTVSLGAHGHIAPGAVYSVARVVRTARECIECDERGAAVLHETGPRCAWCLCILKPIYRPNSEFIERLKRDAPVKEPA